MSIASRREEVSAREIMGTVDGRHRERSTAVGLLLLALNLALYGASLLGIIAVHPLALKVPLMLLNGLFIGTLFVLAHDACHGSLTPHAWLNGLIARIAFLPPLQPYSGWVLGHNRLHHSLTNLRGRDYVWTPLSWQEYRDLGWPARGIQRLYRSPGGLGLYYLIEIWWKHMIFPRFTDIAQVKNKLVYWSDLALVILYVTVAAISVCGLDTLVNGTASRDLASIFGLLVATILVPFLTWNYLSGFLTYMHHTHQRTIWYANRREWSFHRGQLNDTVHVKFPRIIGLLFHNIMEHTAHHVDPKIPLYRLGESQRQLESRFDEIIIEEWTLKGFLATLSTCQLYDYANHRWLSFDGRPTTEGIALNEMADLDQADPSS